MSQSMDTLRHGGVGCISATVNVTSRLAREVYDAHEAAQEDADILQERLTGLRAKIEAYPLIPVLKHLMQHYTHEESWSNLRPPPCRLTEDQAQDLLRRLPVPALL